jgi:TRAP-type mannitol/chloroaromatic compound transport system substrate-binding protein
VWDQLDAPTQAMIDTVCGDNIQDSIAEGESQQPAALKELQAQGAKIHDWPPALLTVFEKKWGEVAAAENARNPNFRKIWDSYSAFRENYAIWRRSGYIRN